ncbi:MAG: DUF1963 domain-containing protein [Planctomycetota bacterium]|nr:MAG: DUF1963 domain-containing protein [Planctomycetota bacterium]REJ94008.1 MAG: DUF1963 domain-containing protein [Planctomycetota bacterium]REK21981.1 MAG: DUF1963 domain-containing protein [Planctomycetota bacterium]REK31270.1 MAG: DUF1963 domain-containing protein [Planctomycetota bacterium]
MSYEFILEDWLPQFLPLEVHGHYSAEVITSPCELCNNEHLRHGMRDQFDWGDPVPTDVFVMSKGEPKDRHVTKIGGLPYRDAEIDWPHTPSGRSMALLAQFNFTDSIDIVGDLPGDLLLIFGDDADGIVEPLRCEWQNVGIDNLVRDLPGDCMRIAPCFGSRCRTESFPDAIHLDQRRKYPQYSGKDVWQPFLLPEYQATQIGRAPFFAQTHRDEAPALPLCTVSTVYPSPHRPFPWVNVEEPICPPGKWPRHEDLLEIGDGGSIYVFIQDDGTLHTMTEW